MVSRGCNAQFAILQPDYEGVVTSRENITKAVLLLFAKLFLFAGKICSQQPAPF
jgi:hypothetical protein